MDSVRQIVVSVMAAILEGSVSQNVTAMEHVTEIT